MDHVLSDQRLRLTYLRDPADIEALDQETIFDDLLDGAPPGEPLPRFDLPDYDHLVLAADLDTSRVLGVLGAVNRQTEAAETFVLLQNAFVIAPARGQNLLRRMLALALLRIAGLGNLPDAVAALTRAPACWHVLRGMAANLRGVRFLPQPEEAVIRLDAAALLHRMAGTLRHRLRHGAARDSMREAGIAARLAQGVRMGEVLAPASLAPKPVLVALDLGRAKEAMLVADLRRMYRARLPRQPVSIVPAPRKPFWPAAALEPHGPAGQ